ncbi:MAG: aminoglycoside phosphotransferase family protein [Candidatus Dormibacteraeota bacterium]|nr:aminoglycoside phosphotransferase family protein [Candidatus Dormibacteraeota bacterium]
MSPTVIQLPMRAGSEPSPLRAGAEDLEDLDDLIDVPGMHSIVVGISKDPNAKIVVLLIPNGASLPAYVVKVPTTDIAAASVESEIHTLSALERVLPGWVGRQVPRVEAVLHFKGRPALVMTALAGSPMTTRYHRWRHTARPGRVVADFEMAGNWLAALQAATAGQRRPVELCPGLPARLRSRFAGDPWQPPALEIVGEACRRLGTTASPRTAVHGDFWAGNMLVDGNELSGIVDWEAGTVSGEPIRDLVRFALTYALYLDRHVLSGVRVPGHNGLRVGTWGAGIEYAVSGQGWFPDLFRRFLQGGMARLGADPRCWREAVLVGISEVAAVADHIEFARQHLRLLAKFGETG